MPDLVRTATVLSSKNPKKGPGKSFIQTSGHCILCLKAILGGNIKYKADYSGATLMESDALGALPSVSLPPSASQEKP